MLSFTKENVIIPKESIRYRIVANSNNDLDQYNKLKANEIIFPIINDIMNNSNNIIEARKNINKNIPLIEKSLDNLNIKYNRIRQSVITQEISEIVGGAEAQK